MRASDILVIEDQAVLFHEILDGKDSSSQIILRIWEEVLVAETHTKYWEKRFDFGYWLNNMWK
jgi:hypothetical protein